MILIEATLKWKGYDPRELSKGSHKRVCCVCDGCGRVRWQQFGSYRDLCKSCVRIGIPRSPETIKNMSDSQTGHITTDETRKAIADGNRGKIISDEIRQHQSAGQQGIPYEEWTGFVSNGEYCELFDDACRERIRLKYGYRCYICDKPQEDNITKNGDCWKLAVHHADKDKNQGCDGVKWVLVPLCMHCHPGAHGDPLKQRIEYLVNDEETAEILQHTERLK